MHSYRLFGIAIIDLLATVALAAVLLWVSPRLPFTLLNIIWLTGVLFLIGQLLHYIFGVNTTFMKFIGFDFPPCNPANPNI